jgi:MFS family permease
LRGSGEAPEVVTSTRTALVATATMLLLHGLCYMGMTVPAVVAPVAARDFGIDASRIGLLVAMNYVWVMLGGVACGIYTARHGIRRVSQASALISAVGLASAAAVGWCAVGLAPWVPPQAMSLLLFFSIALLGLGMGLVNPISSQVLFVSVPQNVRALSFSVKQMGAPIGTAVTGLALPALILVMAWQPAMLVMAIPAVAFAVLGAAMPDWMCRYDHSAAGAPRRVGLAMLTEPIRVMWGSRPLRELALASVVLAMNQMSLSAFLVTYLSLEIGMPLVTAGSLFALTQLGGLVGRIVFGLAADRWITPRRQLALIGLVGGASAVVLAFARPDWPYAVFAVISLIFGATSLGWNGISLSEVARLAGPGQVGMVTGGAQLFMAIGAIVGPIVFAGLVASSGHYTASFIVSAIPVIILGARMLATKTP